LEFEEETRQNPEIGEQIADTELAMAAIELAEDEAMKSRLQGLEGRLRQETPTAAATTTTTAPEAKVVSMKPRQKSSRMKLFGIAAALLLLLAAGWWIMQPGGFDDPGQLAMANFEPYPNIAYQIERSGGDAADPEKEAFIAYEAGDYAKAGIAFNALPKTPVNAFYLGQSYLAQGKYAAATSQFKRLTGTGFNLRQESEYYLALALAGQGETELAIAELNTIVAEAGHPSLKEAKALLEDLR